MQLVGYTERRHTMYRIELNGRTYSVNGKELAAIKAKGHKVTFIL